MARVPARLQPVDGGQAADDQSAEGAPGHDSADQEQRQGCRRHPGYDQRQPDEEEPEPPAQRPRLAGLCDNLQARIDEAEREGWLGEADGLKVSLAAARQKLAQLDELARRRSTIHLGMPGFPDIAVRTVTAPGEQHS